MRLSQTGFVANQFKDLLSVLGFLQNIADHVLILFEKVRSCVALLLPLDHELLSSYRAVVHGSFCDYMIARSRPRYGN